MGFTMNAEDYMEYIKKAAQKINHNSDYITQLDAATGDGDHWVNLNMGFEKLIASSDELKVLPIDDCFKKIGMIMMSTIGGSSGILYGGAYLAAAKGIHGKNEIHSKDLCDVLDAMVQSMIDRGDAKPGYKTMIDALSPAVEIYKNCIEKGLSDKETLITVKQSAIDGAESTKNMEAVRGRARYQTNKGVGHLDPGAITMSYQISTLADYLLEKIN